MFELGEGVMHRRSYRGEKGVLLLRQVQRVEVLRQGRDLHEHGAGKDLLACVPFLLPIHRSDAQCVDSDGKDVFEILRSTESGYNYYFFDSNVLRDNDSSAYDYSSSKGCSKPMTWLVWVVVVVVVVIVIVVIVVLVMSNKKKGGCCGLR